MCDYKGNFNDKYDWAKDQTDKELFRVLKKGIMLLVKDTDGDAAYGAMQDIIATIQVLEEKLVELADENTDLEGVANHYKKRSDMYAGWYGKETTKAEKLQVELDDLKSKVKDLGNEVK